LYQRQRLKDSDPDSIGSADQAPGKSKKWPPKMAPKNGPQRKKKTKKFSCFEELDVLSGGLAAILELRKNSHRTEKKLIQHLRTKH
jgi:hypothetical protein